MAISAVGIVLWRWMRTAKIHRRPTGPVWIGIVAAATFKIAEAVATVVPTPFAVKTTLAWLFTIAVIVMIPLLYLCAGCCANSPRKCWSTCWWDVHRDYAGFADPAALQHRLSSGLGDPTLATLMFLRSTGSSSHDTRS